MPQWLCSRGQGLPGLGGEEAPQLPAGIEGFAPIPCGRGDAQGEEDLRAAAAPQRKVPQVPHRRREQQAPKQPDLLSTCSGTRTRPDLTWSDGDSGQLEALATCPVRSASAPSGPEGGTEY